MKASKVAVGLVVGGLFGAGLGLAACGGSDEQAKFANEADAGFDAAPPPPPPPPVDAGPPPVQNAACDGVQTLAFSTMFEGRKNTEAPYMKAEGAPICGVVSEGQTASGVVMMQPGMCYTVLVQGLPPIVDIEAHIALDLQAGVPPQLAPFVGNPMLAVEGDQGPIGAISPKQNCFRYALPLAFPVKVNIKAKQGSGPVAAQVYGKKVF
jgi:hypothetical protein